MSNTREVTNSQSAWEGLASSGNELWQSLTKAVRGVFSSTEEVEVAIGRGDAPSRSIGMANFEQLRSAVQANVSPSSGAQLMLMESALRDRLEASEVFAELEIGHTDDPDHLLVGLGRYVAGMSADEVADQIEEIWDTKVRYQFWAAHSVEIENDFVEFRAATRPDSTGRYVTVHLVAQPTALPGQRHPR